MLIYKVIIYTKICVDICKCNKYIYKKLETVGNSRSSQNHRVVKVGRDLWKSSSPNLLLK